VLNKVLRWLLQPLTCEQNPSTKSGYYNVLCAEGNVRRWKSVLSAWLADCPEYSDQHQFERHVCFRFKCPKIKLGDYVPPDKQHPWRDRNLYRMLSDANTTAATSGETKSPSVSSFSLLYPQTQKNEIEVSLKYSLALPLQSTV